MKKTLLLATTAMLLSTVAMNTNAASNSAELVIHAQFIKPMELISEQYLGFGLILADGGGKTVIVKNDGTLDPTSTATMISTASFTNYSDTRIAYASLNEGLIRSKGAMLNSNADQTEFIDITEDAVNVLYKLNFSDETVELTDYDGNACGTVSDFNYRFTIDGDDVLAHIGGTLTTANLSTITGTANCFGHTTVTTVMNEDNFAAIQNSAMQNDGY